MMSSRIQPFVYPPSIRPSSLPRNKSRENPKQLSGMATKSMDHSSIGACTAIADISRVLARKKRRERDRKRRQFILEALSGEHGEEQRQKALKYRARRAANACAYRKRHKKRTGGGIRDVLRQEPKKVARVSPSMDWMEDMPNVGSAMENLVGDNVKWHVGFGVVTGCTGVDRADIQLTFHFKDDYGNWHPWLRRQTSLKLGQSNGLIAMRNFHQGDTVTVYCGVKTPRKAHPRCIDSRRYSALLSKLRRGPLKASQKGRQIIVDAAGGGEYCGAHYMNCGCSEESNVKMEPNGRFWATRDIETGEELLFEYDPTGRDDWWKST